MFVPKISFSIPLQINTVSNKRDTGISFGNSLEHDVFTHNSEIDINRLKGLDIPHFRLIDSKSVRGMCLAKKNPQIFTELAESGINTVIDLRKEGSNESGYAKKCHENGLEYFNFKIKENMSFFNLPGTKKESAIEFKLLMDDFVKQLKHFFCLMDSGGAYMGCLLGLHRTDLAVCMNYLLNPEEPQTPPTLSHMFYKDETNFTNKRIGSIKNLLRNLSEKHREYLGLPKNYKEIFDNRIAKLRLMNLV